MESLWALSWQQPKEKCREDKWSSSFTKNPNAASAFTMPKEETKWVNLSRVAPDPEGEREQSGTCGGWSIPKGEHRALLSLWQKLEQHLHILEGELRRIKGEFPSCCETLSHPNPPCCDELGSSWDGECGAHRQTSQNLETATLWACLGQKTASIQEFLCNSQGLRFRIASGRKIARSFEGAMVPKGRRNSSLWEPLERLSRTDTALSYCFHSGGLSKIYLPNWRNLKGNLGKVNL